MRRHAIINKKLRVFLKNARFSQKVCEKAYTTKDGPLCVSAVLATYNRCPYDPTSAEARRNPLRWCLDTLLASPQCPLREIIVVNDASTDFTALFLKSYDSGKVPLKIITLSSSHGSGSARTSGIQQATSDYCLICDDDAVPAPYALAAGTQLFTAIRATDPYAAVLQFPVYLRVSYPTRILNKKYIGRCIPSYGSIDSYFHAIPAEYIQNPLWLADGLLAPFRITNLIGVFLAWRPALLAIGGFPILPWRNGSSEGTELALRLTSAQYTLWFSPDPRLHFCHLRYGAPHYPQHNPLKNNQYKPYQLKELINESARTRTDTGNRFPEEKAYQWKIMSRFVVIGMRSRGGAVLWAFRAFINFVVLNKTEFTGSIISMKIRRLGSRMRIWTKAIRYGILHLRHSERFFENPDNDNTPRKENTACSFRPPLSDSASSHNEKEPRSGSSVTKTISPF